MIVVIGSTSCNPVFLEPAAFFYSTSNSRARTRSYYYFTFHFFAAACQIAAADRGPTNRGIWPARFRQYSATHRGLSRAAFRSFGLSINIAEHSIGCPVLPPTRQDGTQTLALSVTGLNNALQIETSTGIYLSLDTYTPATDFYSFDNFADITLNVQQFVFLTSCTGNPLFTLTYGLTNLASSLDYQLPSSPYYIECSGIVDPCLSDPGSQEGSTPATIPSENSPLVSISIPSLANPSTPSENRFSQFHPS